MYDENAKNGFSLVALKDPEKEFSIDVAEDSLSIPSYWLTDNNEYAELHDIDACNVKHHLDVRYNAAIRGMSVQAYAQNELKECDTIGMLELGEFFLEVFDLNLVDVTIN
jgi:hypothetical protein